MKIGIMQPYFFPYIGYWQLIDEVDLYIIYDDVQYIKGGWINRNRILINGEAKYINVQMMGASVNKEINQIELGINKTQNRKILNTINCAYAKAPYFKDIFPVLENIINYEETNLANYLENSIKKICEYVGIETNIIKSSDIKKTSDLKGQEKIIDICKTLGAKEYINAIGGTKLYDKNEFEKYKIRLRFLKTEEIAYKQYNDIFIPNLSIIDVLMFNSHESIKNIISKYKILSNEEV